MKLVDDARNAWKWFSVQAMVLSIALQGAWEAMPADLKGGIQDSWVHWIAMGLLGVGLAGRLVQQGKPSA